MCTSSDAVRQVLVHVLPAQCPGSQAQIGHYISSEVIVTNESHLRLTHPASDFQHHVDSALFPKISINLDAECFFDLKQLLWLMFGKLFIYHTKTR